jgi:hypothetical protein
MTHTRNSRRYLTVLSGVRSVLNRVMKGNPRLSADLRGDNRIREGNSPRASVFECKGKR